MARYQVATTNYPPPPPNADGCKYSTSNLDFDNECLYFSARPESRTTWHHVLSFHPGANNYLRNLTKGSHVYVEANFELREPEINAEPDSPQGQRQIFLRHGKYFLYIPMIVNHAHFPLKSRKYQTAQSKQPRFFA